MGVSVPERADGWNGVGNKGVASVAARGVVVAGEWPEGAVCGPERVEGQFRQPDACGKFGRNLGCPPGDHLFAGGLVVDGIDPFPLVAHLFEQGGVFGGEPDHEGVVVGIDDQPVDDGFQLAEVHHHPVFRIVGVVARGAAHGHEEFVGVAVDVAAEAVVTFEGVGHLEGEFAGQTDRCHRLFSLCGVYRMTAGDVGIRPRRV